MGQMNQIINQATSSFISFAIGTVVIFFIGALAISYMRTRGVTRKELNLKKVYIHLLTFIAFCSWGIFIFATKLKFLGILVGGAATVGMFLVVKKAIQQMETIDQKPLKLQESRIAEAREPTPAKENNNQKERRQPYRKRYKGKFHLINKTETELMNRLLLAVPAYNVFPQVSMSQIFYMESDCTDTKRKLVEIGKKSVDFVLCRKNDSSIVMAIEFNGPEHDKPERQVSDKTKREALEEAGIPLLVYTSIPDVEIIKTDIVHLVRERLKNEEERNQRIQQSKSLKRASQKLYLRSNETG